MQDSHETATVPELVPVPAPKTSTLAICLVLAATVVWGSQYALIKMSVAIIPPFLFQGIRHLIAFLGFLPFWGRFKLMTKRLFWIILLNAFVYYLLTSLVTIGLEFTTANKGAFMATQYVIFTPFLGYAMFRTKIKPLQVAGVLVVVAGLAIMLFSRETVSDPQAAFNYGDVIVLVGAFFNAVQIVLLEKYTKEIDTMLFVVGQMGMIAAMMLGTSAVLGETVAWGSISIASWIIWIYMGIVAGTITLAIQAWAQKTLDSTRAALLYSLEPVFGIVFGITLLAEALTWSFVIGAGLIMTGIVLSNLKQKQKKEPLAVLEEKPDF
jgi:drug/metabolite transporter (DMT)-like permease